MWGGGCLVQTNVSRWPSSFLCLYAPMWRSPSTNAHQIIPFFSFDLQLLPHLLHVIHLCLLILFFVCFWISLYFLCLMGCNERIFLLALLTDFINTFFLNSSFTENCLVLFWSSALLILLYHFSCYILLRHDLMNVYSCLVVLHGPDPCSSTGLSFSVLLTDLEFNILFDGKWNFL